MDINAILDNNGYDVTNPKYNPNTKKGKLESPTLKTENIREVHPFIISAYEKNKTDAFMFNVNDYEEDIRKIALAAANELYEGPNITSDDVWVTSKEKQKENEARGNIYYDYKRNRALDVYEQLKNSIYKLLNVNK